MSEAAVKYKTIIRNARKAIRNGNLPNHNAFTISEVVGAVIGVPKEIVIEDILNSEFDKE